MKTDPDQTAVLSAHQELIARDVPHRFFERTADAIVVADQRTRRVVYINPAAERVSGRNLREARRLKIEALWPTAGSTRLADIIRRFTRAPRKSLHLDAGAPDNPADRVRLTLMKLGGERPTLVAQLRDSSRVAGWVERANLLQQQLVAAIDAMPDGFVLYDADDRLCFCNRRYREIYATSSAAMIPGASFEDIIRFGLDRGQYKDAIGQEEHWLKRRLSDHERSDRVVEQQLADGTWLRILERPTIDGGRVGLRLDITQVKQQQQALERITQTDELTGLLNRRGVKNSLPTLRRMLDPQEHLVLFHVDLDRFKLVNDLYGYAAGDALLRTIAERLAQVIDADDILARISADEFLILARSAETEAGHLALAQEIIRRIGEPIAVVARTHRIGASVGIAMWSPGEGTDLADIFGAADLAVHAAKAFGKDEAVFFHPDMRERAERTNDMAFEIQLGMTRGELVPFFQPQVRTRTGEVVGFEALIRWRHPERGLVPAQDFLAVAQAAGLTDAIDDLVLDRSCAAVRQLIDWGLRGACVSINVSVPQISDPQIVDRLRCCTERYGIRPENLRIELLESTLLDDRSTQIVRNVHALIADGFAIELDDFGTGHAAIATLRQFAVSRIKVDRSLVQHIDRDADLQLITTAVMNLAKGLGIDALAEGVETEPEQRTLEDIGFTCAQGYLYARPMPLEEIRPFLQERGQLP